jgi:hypothetical protein
MFGTQTSFYNTPPKNTPTIPNLGFKTNFPTLEALTQHECKIDVEHFNQLSKQLLGPLKDSLHAYLLNKLIEKFAK